MMVVFTLISSDSVKGGCITHEERPPLDTRIPLYIAIIVIMLLVNLPFIWMLVTAFKDESEVFTLPPKFYPNFFDFRNFAGAMAQIPMGRYLFNSLFVALSVTLLQLLFNSFAAYGLSRLRFKGRDFIFLILVGTLMVPPEVTLVPLYIIVKNLGMIDSYRVLIIHLSSSAFRDFPSTTVLPGNPRELEEAAIIDGAGHLKIFSPSFSRSRSRRFGRCRSSPSSPIGTSICGRWFQ